MKNTQDIRKALNERKERSAWGRGVKAYAFDLLENVDERQTYDADIIIAEEKKALECLLLNGTENWNEYSWGGCALIYNEDIAERLCSPSELKKTKNGQRRPNSREEWCDTQARALRQAFYMIYSIIRDLNA